MTNDHPLANRESARAFLVDGWVLIIAMGTVDAGQGVGIARVEPTSDPLELRLPSAAPEFRLELLRNGGRAPSSARRYSHADAFLLTTDPERVRIGTTVVLHHAEGADELSFDPLPAELASFTATLPENSNVEATGYSSIFDLRSAVEAAMENFRSSPVSTQAERLCRLTVSEIGLLVGGAGAFHHLYVKVARETEGP